jgi:hypothetical protein
MIQVSYLAALGGSGLRRFVDLDAVIAWLEGQRAIGQPVLIIRMAKC